ncbi:MAG: phosphomannomutase/phosphoglucomutase [Candidatus Falkowbacteria bacterium]
MINPNIFKAYDVRGVYGVDFDDDAANQIALAYVALRQSDPDYNPLQPLKLAVGCDMRVSSPALKEKLISGLLSQGVSVTDFGLVSTPAFYFAVSSYNLDGGIMISASHNPGEWNGFKIVRAKAVPVSGETGLVWMRDKIIANSFEPSLKTGSLEIKKDIAQEQLKHDCQYFNLQNIKPLKIVIDTANGMGAQYIFELFKNLPIVLLPLNFEFDGSFPAHEADPLKEENMAQLQKMIIEKEADLGIATDGDGDRVFFVDDKGKTISPAIIRGLLSKIFLKVKPGSKIGYDVRPGKITEDMIVQNGGIPVVTRVGHSLIKEQMLKENLYFAGESSGHFFLNLPIGCFEMPNIIIGKLLEEFSGCGQKISDYLKPLEKYFSSGEINNEVNNKEIVIKELADKYSDGQIDFLDGITVKYPDYWFNVRASNTENKVRLNLEAVTFQIMEAKREEILAIIKQ